MPSRTCATVSHASIADYSQALKLMPKKSASLYGRGLARRANGDKEGGDADVEAALKVNPDIPKSFAEWGYKQ